MKFRKSFMSYLFVGLLSLSVLTGCGNGDTATPESNTSQEDNGIIENNNTHENNNTNESNSSQEEVESNLTKTKGYLIDSPLHGVTYLCNGNEGLTNAEGMFECVDVPVTFKVGNLTLGTLTAFTADGKVYPQDLLGLERDNYSNAHLKLLARLLQSLDDDGNIKTTITITQGLRDTITKEQEFKDLTANDVSALVSGVGKSFVNECGAMKHLGDKSLNCNSDGSYYVYVPPVVTPTPTPQKTEVKLDVKDLDIKIDNSYSIVIENQSIPFSEINSLKLDIDKNNTLPIIVANKEGRVILLGRKFRGDSQAEISIESTAEVFVLRTTAFFGVQITDDKELSKRIRNHKIFPELVNQLKKGINEGSTCPTDPKCNPWALVLSSKITSTLEIKDLVGDK